MYLIVILLFLISYEMLGQVSHSWTMAMGMFSTIYLSVEYIHGTSFLCKPFKNTKGKKSHFVATLEFCIWGVAKFTFTLVQIHFGCGTERSFWTSS
jgi:hypothetical protein